MGAARERIFTTGQRVGAGRAECLHPDRLRVCRLFVCVLVCLSTCKFLGFRGRMLPPREASFLVVPLLARPYTHRQSDSHTAYRKQRAQSSSASQPATSFGRAVFYGSLVTTRLFPSFVSLFYFCSTFSLLAFLLYSITFYTEPSFCAYFLTWFYFLYFSFVSLFFSARVLRVCTLRDVRFMYFVRSDGVGPASSASAMSLRACAAPLYGEVLRYWLTFPTCRGVHRGPVLLEQQTEITDAG